VGFEPTIPGYGIPLFESGAFNRSATSPVDRVALLLSFRQNSYFVYMCQTKIQGVDGPFSLWIMSGGAITIPGLPFLTPSSRKRLASAFGFVWIMVVFLGLPDKS
jgi:hypothetical protein